MKACVALLVCSSFSAGQIPGQHPRIKPIPREPEYPSTMRPAEPRRNNIVLPSEAPEYCQPESERSVGVIGKIPPEVRPLPEGYVVGGRSARITREGNWYVATLAPVQGLPDSPPLRILPSSQLGLLEAVLTDKTREPAFQLTGRVSEFNGSSYILLEQFIEGSPSRPRAPAYELTVEPGPGGVKLQVTTRPTTGAVTEPSAEEVLKQLMQNRPSRPVVPPTTAPAQPSRAPLGAGERKGPRWTEETSLMDQPGRLIPGDPWWSFAFEDLSDYPQQSPVRLLPNQLLESAIHLSGGGAKGGIVLIVSGDITVHKGVEYMMLRKVLLRRDMGNFR